MLNKLRGFSNTKLAGILIGIIIVPFVFWGMGSVFSGGNTNNVAKIDNEIISTQDFIKHVNQIGLDEDQIRKNIENNIIEDLLSKIISNKLLDMEIKDLNVSLSDKNLVKIIKSNEMFIDKNNFSRVKYEKFLLENSLTAPDFEIKLKKQELKKNLFQYIGGGIKSPYFLKNNIYKQETKIIDIEYFDLNNSYNTEISNLEIDEFINDNKEKLKIDYIDFSYVKIIPKDLVEIGEFNDNFFKKIDEIENYILNGSNIDEIGKKYNLSLITKYKYRLEKNSDEILKEIYSNRNKNKLQLVDKNDYFLLFEIKNIDKILPDKSNSEFIEVVKKNLILKRKFDLHKELFKKIQDKRLNNDEFIKLSNNKNFIKKTSIKGIIDDKIFDSDSIKLLYSLPEESFTLITDENNKIYLAKIKNIYLKELSKNDQKINSYMIKSNSKIMDEIYSTYDLSLNDKYKVKIFRTTLDRVKNYFR